MTGYALALAAETRKALASRVLRTTAVITVVAVAVLATTLSGAARAENEQILTQLGPLAGASGWQLLTGITAQVTAAGFLLASGITLSWLFGREFTDGTISGLFALPVSRPALALAKLTVHLLWVGVVSGVLTATILGCGLALGFGEVDAGVLTRLLRQGLLGLLTGLLAAPAAWAATLGRGPLPGIAAALGVLITGQVSAIALPGLAGWIPLAAPALWALSPGAVTWVQLAATLVVPAGFGALSALAWHRLQLDR